MIKIVSWNTGTSNQFTDFFYTAKADIFCVQELQLPEIQFLRFNPSGYYSYWNWKKKNKQLGTAVFTKLKPISCTWGIGSELDKEGRSMIIEYSKFYLVNVLTPQSSCKYDQVRLEWDIQFSQYIQKLLKKKPVVLCGNLNVAHQPLDVSTSTYEGIGCTKPERIGINHLIELGMVDTYRCCYPLCREYTWHDYDLAMRLDYCLISNNLQTELVNSTINGSLEAAHKPIEITLSLEAPDTVPVIPVNPYMLLYFANKLPKPLESVNE